MKYCNTNWLQRLTIYIENKGNEVHHYKLSLIKTKAELKTSTMHTWRSEYTEQKVINWLLPNKTTVHKCCSGKSLHSWGGQHLNFYHSLHGILAQYHQVVWTVLHCSIPPLLDLQIFAPTICTYWCSNCNMALSPKYFCLKRTYTKRKSHSCLPSSYMWRNYQWSLPPYAEENFLPSTRGCRFFSGTVLKHCHCSLSERPNIKSRQNVLSESFKIQQRQWQLVCSKLLGSLCTSSCVLANLWHHSADSNDNCSIS